MIFDQIAWRLQRVAPERAIPRTRAARQFVNSFNSLLRRLRPTNELRRSLQPRCKNSINSNLRRERPERAVSSQPRATPWESAYKHPRPVRAKVWANGWLLLLPLQGVGNGNMVPRALPWARNLLGFQPAQGRVSPYEKRRSGGMFLNALYWRRCSDGEHRFVWQIIRGWHACGQDGRESPCACA